MTAKVAGVQALACQEHSLIFDSECLLVAGLTIPGRLAKTQLVPPREVKHRSMATLEGRAAMIHALAHIEFNVINLALDAIWHFAGMPDDYYADWLRVAKEEAYHFSLLASHLQTLGFAYGDFSAHDSLWELTEKTSHDILARMALVPRMMEACGLDASSRSSAKLVQAGDHEAAAIIDMILRDEIGHVAIGNCWYGWLCRVRQLEPLATFAALVAQHRAAGFSEQELQALLQPT